MRWPDVPAVDPFQDRQEATITRFFFDIDDGDCLVRDDQGLDFADAQAAAREARRTLPDIAREGRPTDRRDIRITVRSEGGRQVFRTTLSLASEWLEP